ncbi:MAG: TAG lipase/steryl ester hydrolase/phospholipase A2/LPA acyltransferase [Candidatus Pseudothioglobus sp.]|jgi:TAG lipase/steryl ester hydrolase/phospholipase A2/LPA acyltransferase
MLGIIKATDTARMARKNTVKQNPTYKTWETEALANDELSGANDWKATDETKEFDYKVIRRRHKELRQLIDTDDIDGLCYYLNEGIHGNMGGMGAPKLYTKAQHGTKNLINDYTSAIVEALNFLANVPNRTLSKKAKLDLFRRVSLGYGHTSLMLSGAGSLGPFHLGVVKTLFNEGLLPRIISGSSAGAIVAALIGTHSKHELKARFHDNIMTAFFRDAVEAPHRESPNRSLDQYDVKAMIEALIPDMTFLEAFEKTGRYINISVAPKEIMQRSRLLNAVTSPNALIHEAVLASCAIPGLFPAVTLMAKNSKGKRKPYVSSRKWVDGSVSDDLPAKRLARMYGVNHTISSQANPMVLWAIQDPNIQQNLFTQIGAIYQSAAREWLRAVYPWTMELLRDQYPLNVMARGAFSLMTQHYTSDITIMPKKRHRLPSSLIARLTPQQTLDLINDGQTMTWPQVERIRICTAVSRCLDELLIKMDGTIR